MADLSPADFLTGLINSSKTNLDTYIQRLTNNGKRLTNEQILQVAQVQTEQAKAAALAYIGHQLSSIAENLHGQKDGS